MKKIALAIGMLSLASCSPADNEPGPGGVTVGEARALDEAAEMIEAKRLPAQDDGADAGPDAGANTGEQAVEQTEPLEITEAEE